MRSPPSGRSTSGESAARRWGKAKTRSGRSRTGFRGSHDEGDRDASGAKEMGQSARVDSRGVGIRPNGALAVADAQPDLLRAEALRKSPGMQQARRGIPAGLPAGAVAL